MSGVLGFFFVSCLCLSFAVSGEKTPCVPGATPPDMAETGAPAHPEGPPGQSDTLHWCQVQHRKHTDTDFYYWTNSVLQAMNVRLFCSKNMFYKIWNHTYTCSSVRAIFRFNVIGWYYCICCLAALAFLSWTLQLKCLSIKPWLANKTQFQWPFAPHCSFTSFWPEYNHAAQPCFQTCSQYCSKKNPPASQRTFPP